MLENEIKKICRIIGKIRKSTSNEIRKMDQSYIPTKYYILLKMQSMKTYLCFESWEKIAVEMNYSIQHIFRLHSKALKNIEI